MKRRSGVLRSLAGLGDWGLIMAVGAALLAAGFMAGHRFCLSRLYAVQEAVIVDVEAADYRYIGRTVVELPDGRRLARHGVFGRVGERITVRPQHKGDWK